MEELKKLLEFCKSERQKVVIECIIEEGTRAKAAKKLKVKVRNIQKIVQRVRKYAAARGYSLEHDMTKIAPEGFGVKGTSSLYDEEGKLKLQWVKTNKEAEDTLKAIQEAVDLIVEKAEGKAKKTKPIKADHEEMLNLYISNDLHFGALAWGEETQDNDYDLEIADRTLDRAINHLVDNSPNAKTGIICDLGDLLEADDFKNATPHSGHNLDVDGRYPKIIKIAMQAMVKMIDKALTKHEIVHFINISGNHDITSGHAIRAFVEAWYRNEPRVIVDTKPTHQKYFKHGKTLLGFAHGDGLKMHDAGELMAVHCQDIFSDTIHRHYHFGHNHKDKIVDGRICKAESHRNLAPLNSWASHAGFARQLGTMKAMTYSKQYGLENVTIFRVNMDKD